MKILLTGASSFTGFWFAKTLAEAGHEVIATYRGSASGYEGVRASRVGQLNGKIEQIWDVEFGDDAFLDIVRSRSLDIFCHHAAEMTDYRSWEFDALSATRKNTRNFRAVLDGLTANGCVHVVATGSVFEPLEGIGDSGRRAFNPYGLSKHLSYEVMRMEAERQQIVLSKFVIPNPFGPYEEARFTSYLIKEWVAGRSPTVGTPAYVRDNIHVSLLSAAYKRFCEERLGSDTPSKCTPAGYIENQGEFARRLGREMSARLCLECVVDFAEQKNFPEPLVRINNTLAAYDYCPEWSEAAAWDELASYYRSMFMQA